MVFPHVFFPYAGVVLVGWASYLGLLYIVTSPALLLLIYHLIIWSINMAIELAVSWRRSCRIALYSSYFQLVDLPHLHTDYGYVPFVDLLVFFFHTSYLHVYSTSQFWLFSPCIASWQVYLFKRWLCYKTSTSPSNCVWFCLVHISTHRYVDEISLPPSLGALKESWSNSGNGRPRWIFLLPSSNVAQITYIWS